MSGLAGLFPPTAVQAGVAAPVEVSVGQLSRPEALDGRTVRVRGWLRCSHWGCDLRVRPGVPSRGGDATGSSVRVGENDALTPSLAQAVARQVVMEGIATAVCRREVCTDHGPEPMPTRLVRIFEARGATAKDH